MAFLGGLRLAIHRRGAWIPTIRFERPAGGCERPSGPRWLGTTLGGQSDGVKVAAYSRRPGSLLPSVSTSGNVGISSVWRSVSTIVAPVPRSRCQQPRECVIWGTLPSNWGRGSAAGPTKPLIGLVPEWMIGLRHAGRSVLAGERPATPPMPRRTVRRRAILATTLPRR